MLIGIDIDGVLLPLKGKSDNLQVIRHAAMSAKYEKKSVHLLTSRHDVQDALRKLRQYGLDLPVHQFPRAQPEGKGAWLMANNTFTMRPQLWDDEVYFLDPAHKLGVECLVVLNGRLHPILFKILNKAYNILWTKH